MQRLQLGEDMASLFLRGPAAVVCGLGVPKVIKHSLQGVREAVFSGNTFHG
jgi:hypothetical protein